MRSFLAFSDSRMAIPGGEQSVCTYQPLLCAGVVTEISYIISVLDCRCNRRPSLAENKVPIEGSLLIPSPEVALHALAVGDSLQLDLGL